jgi:uncharacterized protein (TIGR02231 family)
MTPFRSFLIISFAVLSCGRLAAAELPVASRITSVELYRQGARITEVGSVKLNPGEHELVFSGLSRSLQANSLSVKGSGAGVILLVKDRVSYLNRTAPPARAAALQDSIEEIDLRRQVIADERFVLESEQSLILKNNSVGGTEQGVGAERLQQVADLYRSRLGALRARLRELALEEKKLAERRGRLQAEQGQWQARRDEPTQEVVVVFRAEAAGKVELELSYLVQAASWTPFYDLRVENTASPLQLYLKANVVNNTGVEWKQVKLSLTTNNNAAGSQSPTLSPWSLALAPQPMMLDEAVIAGYGGNRKSLPAAAPQADGRAYEAEALRREGLDDVIAQYAYDYTQASEGELGLEYAIALPYDIPSDGQEHQVDILRSEVSAEYLHYAVPKLDRDAFLVASIRQDLLRSRANVYFEGSFVGETLVNTDNPRDSMRISLGRDARVQVQREQIRDFSAEKQIGSSIKREYGFEITLRNNKSTPVKMIVEDQIPLSQNKEIEVELTEASGGVLDPASGRLSWALDLKPGETRKLTLRFEVKYPKDRPVLGL